jgi:hypothetical protein
MRRVRFSAPRPPRWQHPALPAPAPRGVLHLMARRRRAATGTVMLAYVPAGR